MKLKFKLSVLVIAIMVIALIGLAMLLVRKASDISLNLSIQGIEYLAEDKASYWKSKQDGHLLVLHTIADIMEQYENMPVEARRARFDDILFGVMVANPDFMGIYTVWKPNAIDGMDDKYIDRTGSGPTGQYAITYVRQGGAISSRTTIDIDASMAYINGPNSKNDRVEQPFLRKIDGKDVYLLRLMVPIINPRTNEVVGGVGCLLDISVIQSMVEQVLAEHKEIAALTIFANNGFILGHKVPERVGKMLQDVEMLFGKHINEADKAVGEGRKYRLKTYSPVLKSNVELIMIPFTMGNSNTTWSVMVVSTENHILAPVRAITKYAAIIVILSILIMAAILFVVFQRKY